MTHFRIIPVFALVAILLVSGFAVNSAFAITEDFKLTASDAEARDRFGRSVSISGDTAVVGAWLDDYQLNNTGPQLSNAGSAYIFEKDASGTWNQIQKLTPSDAESTGVFGFSVSISDNTVIIGSIDDSPATAAGSAYIFEETSPGVWTQIQKLVASDAQPADQFGRSVSIFGDMAVVGAWFDDDNGFNSGSAYIFEKDASGTWNQIDKLVALDGEPLDHFGEAVSISGNIAIVGAKNDDSLSKVNSGSAYIFEETSPGVWTQIQKLVASDAQPADQFGKSVSIFGDTAVVGAWFDDSPKPDAGSAYIFEKDNGGADNWGEIKKITSSDAQDNDQFGFSVSISGNRAIVGAVFGEIVNTDTGSAYVFEKDNGGANNWGEVVELSATDASIADDFGRSVSISGNTALVGAELNEFPINSGSAYIFDFNDTAEIHGTKWLDTNGDGIFDSAEVGFQGIQIQLFGTATIVSTSSTTTVFQQTTTDVDGAYWFTGLAPGDYHVTEILTSSLSMVQTFPLTGSHDVILAPGEIVTGLDFGNKFVTPAPCWSTNPNLFVSTENIFTSNTFGGPMVTEVIVCDSDISDPNQAKGEPDVTVNGRILRMTQDNTGLWHGYFADKTQAQLADQSAISGGPGVDLDFGYFCSNQSTIPINFTPPTPFTPFGDTAGIALPITTTISGSQGTAPLPICSGVATSSNHNNVINGFPTVNSGTSISSGIGQIDIADIQLWPFVQLYNFVETGNVIVQYNKGGGSQSTTLIFDSSSLTVDSDGDGIADSVDTDPTNSSSQFSDIPLGGTTFGSIISLGDQSLTILEDANPNGVQISASSHGGPLPATISDCNGTIYTLSAGDIVLLTCASSDAKVIRGPVEVEYFIGGSSFATITLQTDDDVTFEQDTLTFTNNGDKPVEIIVNGKTVPIKSGETVTLSSDSSTPRILKQNAQTDLAALEVTDKKDKKRISKADKEIGKSLEDKLWQDDSTLTKKGKKVFDHEKKAVKELSKVKSVDVSGIIAALVSADKSLAQSAIDSIPTDTGDKKIDKQIAKANKEMAKAQEKLEEDKPDNAIDRYKKAWEHAQKAIKQTDDDD